MSMALITSFVCSFIGLMALLLGWLAANFIKGLQDSIDALNETIKEMGKAMTLMERKLDRQEMEIEANTKALEELLHQPHFPPNVPASCPVVGGLNG